MKEITLETKIADLLNDYEGMKDILIKINPKFKKLNNPVLRRTLAKVAGVKQAAIVGGMDPLDLLNQLRTAVGQTPVEGMAQERVSDVAEEVPAWTEKEPKVSLNANRILDEELNPLAELHKAMKGLEEGDVVVIEADFRPEPLIEEFQKSGHEVYCQEAEADRFVTYIQK
jgi:TusA-related sulfurtransferase